MLPQITDPNVLVGPETARRRRGLPTDRRAGARPDPGLLHAHRGRPVRLPGRSPRPTRSPTSTRWAGARSPCSRSSGFRATRSRWRSSARCCGAGAEKARGGSERRRGPLHRRRGAQDQLCGGGPGPPGSGLARNVGARPGDALVLTKPLGTGIISTAIKQAKAPERAVTAAIRQHGDPQPVGGRGGCHGTVHAVTDVTGFGLLGHLQEMSQGSKVRVRLQAGRDPAPPRRRGVSPRPG